EQINGTRFNVMYFSCSTIFNSSFTGKAVHRFKMILIVHWQFRTLINGGDMERKAHIVTFQQQPGALPASGDNAAISFFGILLYSNNHISSCKRYNFQS